MYGGFDSQIFLGNRDFYILDNGQDLNKPLIMRENNTQNNLRRNPSETENDLIDSENVVGLMGDDEDIQQAQYNVMSLIDERLDQLNGDIKNKLEMSVNNRITEIQNMMSILEENRISTFNEINDLRMITERQTEIMSNIGILVDDEGLQEDMQDLDNLVFSQYENMGEGVRSPLNVPSSPSPPEQRDEHYGKKEGKTYYSTDPKIYDKYNQFPYYLSMKNEWYKNKKISELECKGDDYCTIQPEDLKCNAQTEKKFNEKDGKNRAFKKNIKRDSCVLEYNPDDEVYKCGDLQYKDSLYPLATVEDDFRECMPEIFISYNGDKIISLIFFTIILYLIFFVLQLDISDEEFHKGRFFFAIFISIILFLLMYFNKFIIPLFGVVYKNPIFSVAPYDYFYMTHIPSTDYRNPLSGLGRVPRFLSIIVFPIILNIFFILIFKICLK